MLPIVPFDVLLPLAIGAGVLVVVLTAFILLRRAFVRWWSRGGERARQKVRALLLAARVEEGGGPATGRLVRWISRGRAARLGLFGEAVRTVSRDDPELVPLLRRSPVPGVLAKIARGRRGGGGVRVGRWRRVEALRLLGEFQLGERNALLEGLDDPDLEVAYAAAEAIATVDFPEGARAIFQRIGPDCPLLDSRLATMLENMESGVDEVLRAGLESDDLKVLYWALTLVGRKGIYELVEEVRPQLEHPDPDVRVAACKSLGLLRLKLSDRWLAPLLQDPVWFVQAQAVKALGAMEAGWASGEIAGLLESPHWWVRQNATQALIEIGGAAEDAAAEALQSSDRYARNSAVEVLARTGWVEATVRRAAGGDARARELIERYSRSGGLGHLENALQQVSPDLVPFLLSVLETTGDDATYGRIRAARHGRPEELRTLFLESADRVRSR